MKKFETLPQVKHFTKQGSLQKLTCVIQNTRVVKQQLQGIECMLFAYLWNNMKKNEFALIFDEDNILLGYVKKNDIGIPQRYLEMEELTFEDMYTKVAD